MTQLENTIICPSCHARLTGYPKYCMKCGTKISYQAVESEAVNQKRSVNLSLKKNLKPSIPINSLPLMHNTASSVSPAASSPSINTRNKSDYWEPEKMKALIFSIAAAIGILLTALGLWVISSIDSSVATFYLARIQMLRFMLFGVLIVIGSLFFMTLMEVRSRT
ncbi:MAG: hypothetical protein QXV32_07750 [Conexivisphaerales archaeon]